MSNLTRRQVMKAGIGASAMFAAPPAWSAEPTPSLRKIAADKGLIYGVATSSGRLAEDPKYAQLVATQAGMLVAEGETKRGSLEPKRGHLNFDGANKILRFAKANGQKMRGHTLVWHIGNPEWLVDALEKKPDEDLLVGYIDKVCTKFKGQFHSWDVVNEAVDLNQGHPDGLRTDSIWYKAFGDRYIDMAFHAARAADPSALLCLNDGNTEADAWWGEDMRVGSLKVLDKLLSRNVPIDIFGMEAHLKVYKADYSDKMISDFMDELIARGLKILITEFDVADIRGPADAVQRDADVAALTRRFLDVAFSKPEVLGCLNWGITDRYSWLSSYPDYKWSDGQFSRGLPFDENYKPKPMFNAMVAAYKAK